MVDVKSISKAYGTGENKTNIFEDASLTVGKGELVALMGRSGCGKSTILNIISGIQTPDQGTVIISGSELNYASSKDRVKIRRNTIGYVIQNFGLISGRTAWENVTLMVRSRKYKKDDYRMVHELFEELGIADKERCYISNLSNGEKQRVAIVRALVDDKAIILADEPTGALDIENADRVMRVFRLLADTRKTTIIVATHDPEVAGYCDRIIRIDRKKFL